jgi:uncharacterized protein YerC
MAKTQTTLYGAVLVCTTEAEVKAFLEDLLSKPEIKKAKLRWKIAQTMLQTNCSKREAQRRYKASQELVRRVFKAAALPHSGYRLVHSRTMNSYGP